MLPDFAPSLGPYPLLDAKVLDDAESQSREPLAAYRTLPKARFWVLVAPLDGDELTGTTPKQAAIDKGFRGCKYHSAGVQVLVAGTRKFEGILKRLVKQRSAIEPVIGRLKQDHALKRNYLRGNLGDGINALLAACGFNLRKLYRRFSECPLLS